MKRRLGCVVTYPLYVERCQVKTEQGDCLGRHFLHSSGIILSVGFHLAVTI
jgi:hypothetical protein